MNILRKYINESFEEIHFIEGLYSTYQKMRDLINKSDDPEKIYHSGEKVKNVLDNAIGIIYLHKEDYIDDMETWEGTLRDFQALKRRHAEKTIEARDYLLARGYEL